jgi:hypothetical protein
MAISMPKSYMKSLHPELKRPRAHIYETGHKLPDPPQLQLPAADLGRQEGRNTTGRAARNQLSHESIFNRTIQKPLSPAANESPLEYADTAQNETGYGTAGSQLAPIAEHKRTLKTNMSQKTFNT